MNHTQYVCQCGTCSFCEGGLFYCTVCTCAEASLATECPGERVPTTKQDQIMAGVIDFLGGVWVDR